MFAMPARSENSPEILECQSKRAHRGPLGRPTITSARTGLRMEIRVIVTGDSLNDSRLPKRRCSTNDQKFFARSRMSTRTHTGK